MAEKKKNKTKTKPELRNITIHGLISFYGTGRASKCAKYLFKSLPHLYKKPTINVYYDYQWVEIVKTLRTKYGHQYRKLNYLRHPVIVFFNDQYIGDHRAIIYYVISEHRILPDLPYPNLFPDFTDLLPKNDRKVYVYLDVRVGDLDDYVVGKMVFELFADLVPETCKYFANFCKSSHERVYGTNEEKWKFSYLGSAFHRICGRTFVQGGKIPGCELHVQDESYSVSHCRRGVISICNDGSNNSTTEFCISLKENTWLDDKLVAFGQMIFGEPILTAIQDVPTYYQRPLKEIIIVGCGVIPSQEDLVYHHFTSTIEKEKALINEDVEELRKRRLEDLNNFEEKVKNFLLASETERSVEYRYLEEIKEQMEEMSEGLEEEETIHEELEEKYHLDYQYTSDFTLQQLMKQRRANHTSGLLKLMFKLIDNIVEHRIDYAESSDQTEPLDYIPKEVIRDAVDVRDVPSGELKEEKFKAGLYSLPKSLRQTLVETFNRLSPSQLKLIGMESRDILKKAGLGEDTLSIVSCENVVSGLVLAVLDLSHLHAGSPILQELLEEIREDTVQLLQQKGPEAVRVMLGANDSLNVEGSSSVSTS